MIHQLFRHHSNTIGQVTGTNCSKAILATLAILVWHFYQVFFDPDVYPMNWAWWDGKMPVEHYREEHGLDTEAIAEAENALSKPSGADNKTNPESESPKQ